MPVPALLLPLALHLDALQRQSNQKPPADNDVVAGWVAFGIFLLLAAAIALLGWSLSRQFKKVRAAKEAGVFDDPEGADDADAKDDAESGTPQA